jgi:Mg-chelatase subunit ChlD
MVRRWNLTLCSALLLGVAAHPQSSASATSPTSGGSPLQVFTTISTKSGSPPALDPSVLNATIDKRPVQVASIRPAKDDKLLFVLLVDISTSEAPKAQVIKDAAVRVFDGLSTGANQGYLVLFNQLVMPSKRPLSTSEVQTTLDEIRFNGGTAVYDGIAQSCAQILSASQHPDMSRRILIVLSNGDDNYSHITFAQAEESAQRLGVTVFSLAESSASTKGEAILKQISRDTGGREVFVDKLPEGITPLLASIQSQWVLNIGPSQAADQKLHSLSVNTSQKDLSIFAPSRIQLP